MAGRLEQRGEDRWRLTVSGGVGLNGKRIRHTKTIIATSSRAAEKELAKFVAEVEKGNFCNTEKITFTDFVNRWLKEHAEKELAPKTVHRYKEILSTRILPALGHIKIAKLSPLHIMEFLDMLREDGIRKDKKSGGLSEKTILQHFRIISSILQSAVYWQVIPANPAERVKAPRAERKEATCYNNEETMLMLKALETEPFNYQVMISLSAATGLRRGELLGLEWKDIDFKEETLSVRQAVICIPRQPLIMGEPKTEKSKRTIAIPQSTLAVLKKYRALQLEEKMRCRQLWEGCEYDLLFCTWNGHIMHPSTLTKWFPAFLKRHKLRHMNLHGLRHTSATLLINAGESVAAVSGRLGHSRGSTTEDIYYHFLKEKDNKLASTMDDILKKVPQ